MTNSLSKASDIFLRPNYYVLGFLIYYPLLRFYSDSSSSLFGPLASSLNILSALLGLLASIYVVVLFLVTYSKKKLSGIVYFGGAFFVLFITFSMLNNVTLSFLQNGAWYALLVRCVPSFLIIFCIEDWGKFSCAVFRMSPIMLVCTFLVIAFPSTMTSDYMSASAHFMIPSLMLLYHGMRVKNKVSILIGVLGILNIVLYGARSILFAVFLSVALAILFWIKDKYTTRKSTTLISFLLLALAFLIPISFGVLSEQLLKIMPESRTLMLLASGQLFDGGTAASREIAYTTCLESVFQNPFMPQGAFADRQMVWDAWSLYYTYPDASGVESSYVHNYFIELLVNFGLIGGLAASLFSIYLIISGFRVAWVHSDDPIFRSMFLIFVVPEFCRLMISSSYLIDPMAWFMFGVLFRLFSVRSTILSQGSEIGRLIS